MSLNPMSLIGVGRVGLKPNSDNVTNFTLFFLKANSGCAVTFETWWGGIPWRSLEVHSDFGK